MVIQINFKVRRSIWEKCINEPTSPPLHILFGVISKLVRREDPCTGVSFTDYTRTAIYRDILEYVYMYIVHCTMYIVQCT